MISFQAKNREGKAVKNSIRGNLAVIIMAGGSGTRFWPASRENIPKQFLPICGPRPMLEESFLRVAPLADPDRFFVIINGRHHGLAEQILGKRGVAILDEPHGRNTAPCIGLGCIHVLKTLGNIPVIALPADSFITDEARFRDCLKRGVSLLQQASIVTMGILPTHPETGYGYIEKGTPLNVQEETAFRVRRFTEKPDGETARGFLASGNYLWNAGVFLFKPETMLKEIGVHLPQMRKGLDLIAEAIGTDQYPSVLEKVYRTTAPISIDYGVIEKTGEPIYVIPGDFGWSDVGSWSAVRELRAAERDEAGNLASGKTLLLHTRDASIHSQTNRLIAVFGLKDLLIVDTEDVLLVADINHSQELRRFPEMLKQKGWTQWL